MIKHKIGYNIKNTNSNNTYIEMEKNDTDKFLHTILSLNTYVQELSLSNDPDIVAFISWYRKPDKRFPYNKRCSRRNTPETMIAGLINNMVFGNQENLSLEQLPYYEEIINTCVEIIEEFRVVKNFDLQKKPHLIQIQFGLHF